MDALLRFDSGRSGPIAGHESLLVLSSGRLVYYLAVALDSSRRRQAGTYTAQLDEAGFEAAQELADKLSRVPAERVRPVRGIFQRSVTFFKGEAAQTFSLINDPPDPSPLQLAAEQLAKWQVLAEANPLAAVAMRAHLVRNADQDRLSFSFQNPGTQPVEFLLNPQGFSLSLDPAAGRPAWKNRTPPRIGLMTTSGNLVDGLMIPAVLNPGERASMTFRLPAGTLPPGTAGSGQVSGWLSLLPPDDSPPPYPETHMLLSCPAETRPG